MSSHHAVEALMTALPVTDGQVILRPLLWSDFVICEDLTRGSAEAGTGMNVSATISQALNGAFQGSAAVIAIAEAPEGRFLGIVLLFGFQEGEAEIGYWIAPRFRFRGYAAAAAALLVRSAHSAGFLRLTARTVVSATASIRILRKIGFQPSESQGRNGGVLEFKLDRSSLAPFKL